ncbi:MAG: hypothetical protein WBM54_04850 [Woeseia sp.]
MNKGLKNAIRGLLVGGVAAGLSGVALAATQGTVGPNSTGTLDITLGVSDAVRISNLADINLGAFAGVDAVGTSVACVFRNGTGNYQLTATGSGPLGEFRLANGTDTVDYSVRYNDANTGAQAVTSGTLLSGLTGADPVSSTCATTGNNATVEVTVAATDAAGLPAATYAGTLTLVVAPE